MKISNLSQSKEWEEFQKSLDRKTFRVNDNLLIKNNLPFGKSYLYCPRGPEELTDEFIKDAKELAKKEKSIFIRIEPLSNIQYPISNIFRSNPVQPPSTLVLDLKKSEEELLSDMKQKTRYNINLAKKRGVEIERTTDPEKIDIFYKILTETTKRDRFRGHSKKYYQKMMEMLGKREMVSIYLAKYEGKYIAVNIVSFFGNTVSYLHGASSNEYRNLMAPHLLQWQAILDAKERGMEFYDFWGIAENDNESHPWTGVTRFKKGFGGEEIHYPGTFDLVISRTWYLIYRVMRILNRIKNF